MAGGESEGAAAPTELPDLAAEAVEVAAPAFGAAGEALGHYGEEWQRELMAFAAERLRADMDLPAALAACRSPFGLAEVQGRWFAAAAEAWIGESARLAELAVFAARTAGACWLGALGPSAADERR